MTKKISPIKLFSLAVFLVSTFMQLASASHAPQGREIIIDLNNGVSAAEYRYVDYYGTPIYKVYLVDSNSYYRPRPNYYSNSYYPQYRNYPYQYNYGNSYGPSYLNYRYFDNDNCQYFDRDDLKWREDKVCAWANKGGFREEVQRKRAINFLYDSATNRYASNFGVESGKAFDYNFENPKNPSDWRNKPAYDPITYGVNGRYNYYYKPRLDAQTGAYDWRF